MPTPSKQLIVSLHDAHPGSWSDIEEQIDFLSELGIDRCSILLVPEFHHEFGPASWTPEMLETLSTHQEVGYDLVLHGYYHDRVGQPDTIKNVFWTRLYTNHEAEFLDLPEAEAELRIKEGLDFFAKNKWQANGFIAPAWLMSPGLPALLRRLGFQYTNRLTELIPFTAAPDRSVTIPSQSLCYSTRALWRRFASLRWNRMLYSRLRRTSLVRLSLHPRDLQYNLIRFQIQSLLRDTLEEGFEPTTYAAYVAH